MEFTFTISLSDPFPQDPAAEVTPWENGVRVVSFHMPLKIPDFVKKIIGVESVKVREGGQPGGKKHYILDEKSPHYRLSHIQLVSQVHEKQTVVWHSGSHFSVQSETVIDNVPGVWVSGGRLDGVCTQSASHCIS